ncbi:hypothetical protein [Planotetraspora phitsanulokensis]|uniref:Uncharacterized protein n=1 Tax=Planotetraspora phitsanulokensis TaxID=575192 RepID=A0A8J3XHX6_9ACTN|nr:hypothetical protein [Planotetraspora phitsanulokensis]GII42502.1 hypothetical protein Pph01_75050 [Planotetraspora phitsanulokensis]
MPICTAILTTALLAGPAASPADPVPAAHKSLANKTTKQQTPDKIADRDATRHAVHKAATPATRTDDDHPVQESSASSDSGSSGSGSEKASFQKSESWSSDPHAGGDSQFLDTKKTRKAGQGHHGRNGTRALAPRGEDVPRAKGAADAPAAPAARPAHAPVIEPAVASAAKPAVAPAVKHAPGVKNAPTVKQAPADKQDSAVKQAPADKQDSAVKQAPADKQAPVAKQASAVKHAPADKHAPEPRPALAPAVEVPKIAAEAPLVKKKKAEPTAEPAHKFLAPKDVRDLEAAEDFDPTMADDETVEDDAVPEGVRFPGASTGSNPRDVMINPSGMPLPKNLYALPAMRGLQRAVARSHVDHGRHSLRHPHHQQGHGEA